MLPTRSTSVALTLSATDPSGVTQMRFSNNNVDWSTPETYQTNKTWTLVSGDGAKTVYARFKDGAGNWSGSVSDGITLDATRPVTTATPGGGTYTTSVTVTLTSSSDAAKIFYSTDGWETSPVYTGPITISTTTTLEFGAQDKAGNGEVPKSATYIIQ